MTMYYALTRISVGNVHKIDYCKTLYQVQYSTVSSDTKYFRRYFLRATKCLGRNKSVYHEALLLISYLGGVTPMSSRTGLVIMFGKAVDQNRFLKLKLVIAGPEIRLPCSSNIFLSSYWHLVSSYCIEKGSVTVGTHCSFFAKVKTYEHFLG